jgi:hypothetical protein
MRGLQRGLITKSGDGGLASGVLMIFVDTGNVSSPAAPRARRDAMRAFCSIRGICRHLKYRFGMDLSKLYCSRACFRGIEIFFC